MQGESITIDELRALDADAAVVRLSDLADARVAELLQALGPGRAVAILDRFGAERRRRITAGEGDPWLAGVDWPEGSVGRLMEAPPAVFGPEVAVAEAIATLRPLVAHRLITYLFIVDAGRRLLGVVAFREIAFAKPAQRLGELMVPRPFALHPATPVIDAMRHVVQRHYLSSPA